MRPVIGFNSRHLVPRLQPAQRLLEAGASKLVHHNIFEVDFQLVKKTASPSTPGFEIAHMPTECVAPTSQIAFKGAPVAGSYRFAVQTFRKSDQHPLFSDEHS